MTSWRRALLVVCGWATAGVAVGAESTALDNYLAGLSTWSASFTQSSVDAGSRAMPGGSGKLVIVRPGKLRWEFLPEGSDLAQLSIADGRNLWFLDRDLDQATVRPLAEELPQSPLMLLAADRDLRGAFTVQATGKRDGYEWVTVQPKDPASDFREAQFGFKGRELARLVIVTKLGQRSTLAFKDVKRNARVDPGVTEFVLPDGVDLVGKPVAP